MLHKNDSIFVGKLFLIDDEDRILLLKRPHGIKFGGLWDIPGGHVHKDETVKRGIARETFEETNLIVSENSLKFFQKIENIYFFWTDRWKGDFKLSWEHNDYVWAKIEDLADHDAGEKFNEIFRDFHKLIRS